SSYADLQDMKHWNQAPANLKMLADAGVPFVLTTYEAEDNFRVNLLKAVEYGLEEEEALAALTTIPAKLIGQEGKLGTLREGAWANFLITSGNYFDKETLIYENWVQGNRAIIEDMNLVDLSGSYDLAVGGNTYTVKISGEPSKPKAEVTTGSSKIGSEIDYKDNWLTLLLSSPDTTKTAYTRLVSKIEPGTRALIGKAILSDGTETSFTAIKTAEASEDEATEDKEPEYPEVVPVTFPNMAYGFEELPKQETL